jgi:formylglycine-generating enzyme required for sulfatase activity
MLENSSHGCGEQPLELFFMKNQFLLYAAIALPMFVGCNENSIDNTDKNKSEESQAVVPPDETVVVTSEHGTATINLINVEGGTFTMGCIESRDGTCQDIELPIHSVTLSTYKIGQFEVTQKLWRVVMGSLPSRLTSGSTDYGRGDNYPVYYVSWDNIVNEFLPELNRLTGKQFRLPTEAEWEYAARGGKDSKGYKYSGSNNIENVAWYKDNAYDANPRTYTHIVGTKSPNELGLYDMSGNVQEWCSDWYVSYTSDAQVNPQGAESGSYPYRVLRGGDWEFNAEFCRAAFRNGDTSDDIGDGNCGFRGSRVLV